MKKVKIGDQYIIPSGSKLWFINLQQSLITTKKYVIQVTHTVCDNDTSFFGDLYEVTFESPGSIPGLLKVLHGETMSDLSSIEPLGNTLKPKFFEYHYNTDKIKD